MKYKDIIKGEGEGEAKEFVYSKIRQAQWVVKCISRRQETLYNIISAIVHKQTEFFDKGEGYIKPLTLNDIASDAGIHESTVSRTARGKYIQCRHGVYPLNYFFRQAAAEARQDPLAAQAGAVQGQGYQVRRRNHPPQGR